LDTLKGFENKVRDYEKKLAVSEEEKTKLKDIIQSRDKTIALLGKEKLGFSRKEAEHFSKLRNAEISIKELEQKLAVLGEAKTSADEAIRDKEKAIADLKQGQQEFFRKQEEYLTKLKNSELKLNDYGNKLSLLQQERSDLSKALQGRDKEIADLKKARQTLLKKEEGYLSKLKNLGIAQEGDRERIGQQDAGIKDLKSKIALLEKENSSLKSQTQQLSTNVNDKEKFISELERKHKNLLMEQGENLAKIKSHENKLAVLRNDKISLENMIAEKESSWKSQKQGFSGSIQDMEKELETARKREKELLTKQREYLQELKDYEKKLTALTNEKTALENVVKEKDNTWQSLTEQLSASVQDKENVIARLKEDGKASLARQEEQRIKIKKNEEKLKGYEGYEDKYKKEISELKEKISSMKNIIKEKEKMADALNTYMSATIQEKDKALTDARKREQALHTNNTKVLTKVNNYKARISELEGERAALEIQLRDYEKKERNWAAEEERLHHEMDKREKKITDAWKINDELQKKNKELYTDKKILNKKIQAYSKKLANSAVLKDRLMKDSAVVHYNLGVIHTQRQEYTDAVTEFSKVLDLNPTDPATHYNLGIIYSEYFNNRQKAIMHFKRYLSGATPTDRDLDHAKKYILTWEKWEAE